MALRLLWYDYVNVIRPVFFLLIDLVYYDKGLKGFWIVISAGDQGVDETNFLNFYPVKMHVSVRLSVELEPETVN